MNIFRFILIIVLVPAILYSGYILFTRVLDSNQSPNFDRTICWNYGRVTDASAYWKNGCGGSRPIPGVSCIKTLVSMTEDEIVEWRKWEAAGKPSIEGCY